jgi:hypothetical protein
VIGVRSQRRLLVVQYAGDYRETWYRLKAGGSEIYFAQRYSDQAIADLARAGDRVAVVIGITDTAYEETLAEGLVAVGLGAGGAVHEKSVIDYAEAFEPTHLLLRAPFEEVLAWAIQGDMRIALTLADSFGTGVKAWLRTRRLVRLCNTARVDWVANHGVASTRSLARLGVDAAKLIPWDWPHGNSPADRGPKSLAADRPVWQALYVGAVAELKGVGDAIRAVAVLAQRGFKVVLDVIGSGDDFAALARQLGVADQVRFLGRRPNEAIITAMRDADVVLVPSRKAYPEGFPLTIYEALCSRTPIVASDHPMFVDKLRPDQSAVTFPSGDANALAAAIERLLTSPDLYAALSVAALETWQGLQVPMKWADLVRAWAEGSDDTRRWLAAHAWATGHYS